MTFNETMQLRYYVFWAFIAGYKAAQNVLRKLRKYLKQEKLSAQKSTNIKYE